MQTRIQFPLVRAAVAALAMLANPGIAEAVDPAGLIYAQPGQIKGKIQKGGKFSDEVLLSVIEFGPRDGVPEGSFRLSIDDGSGPFEVTGSYVYDGKRVTLTLFLDPVTAQLENLLEAEGDLPPGSVTLSCEGSAKTKIKTKGTLERAATRVKIRCLASIEGVPDTLKASFGFKGKGESL